MKLFHEKLELKYDIEALIKGLDSLYALGEPLQSTEAFGGWSIQSDTGHWQRGFEAGRSFTRKLEDDGVERARASHEYYKRTEACTGIWSDILDDLEEKGFYPHRARVTILQPGQAMEWHQDAPLDSYCVRLHIPIITHEDCSYEVQNTGAVHMPADGHAHLVDSAVMHRAWNRGESLRIHFLAQVWDTKGYSENFVVTESTRGIRSFHEMTGFHVYRKVIDEKNG